jgi:hypothetical protein
MRVCYQYKKRKNNMPGTKLSILELDDDCLQLIMKHLAPSDLKNWSSACTTFWILSHESENPFFILANILNQAGHLNKNKCESLCMSTSISTMGLIFLFIGCLTPITENFPLAAKLFTLSIGAVQLIIGSTMIINRCRQVKRLDQFLKTLGELSEKNRGEALAIELKEEKKRYKQKPISYWSDLKTQVQLYQPIDTEQTEAEKLKTDVRRILCKIWEKRIGLLQSCKENIIEISHRSTKCCL